MNRKHHTRQDEQRNRLYQLLAIGKAKLGWDDEFYYGIWLPIQGATLNDKGRYSATTLSQTQLQAAVDVMRSHGFNTTSPKKYKAAVSDWRTPRIAKITVLWNILANASVVDNSRRSMELFCKRHSGLDKLQWATSKQLNTCIETLKDVAKRNNVKLEV
jgi:hypothetical protein